MRGAVVVALLVGCNQVWDLDDTRGLPPEPDGDGDRVPDRIDNCRSVANPTQADSDGDHVGDACDNCPFMENALQENIGDNDTAGDLCDPHPTLGDCVLLVDTFADEARFDERWMAIGNLQARAGFVELMPGSGQAGFTSRELAGHFAVELHGETTVATGASVEAVSSMTDAHRYWCALVGAVEREQLDLGFQQGTLAPSDFSRLSSAPATAAFTIRLFASGLFSPTIPDACRIDHGVAISAHVNLIDVYPDLAGGAPGAIARGTNARIDGITITQTRSGTCPETILR
jgi:hypothetical protein